MKCLIAEESQVTRCRNDAVHIAPLSLVHNLSSLFPLHDLAAHSLLYNLVHLSLVHNLAHCSLLLNLPARPWHLHDPLLLPSPPNHPVKVLDFEHKKK